MSATATTDPQSDPGRPKQYGFFGHPIGLSTLFATEFWERFSYYGMRAILLYYMYDKLENGGLGLDKGLAASLLSIYGSLVYMAGVPGGWLADRVLGARRSVAVGAVLIIFGHICLSLPGGGVGALYGSMVLIILGTGLLKTNVSKIVGDLYDEQDTRRDAGFSIFYMSINLGAFISPFVVSGLKTAGGYHLGFIAAAVGMVLGLIWYVASRRVLGRAGNAPVNPITPAERNVVLTRLGLVLAAVVVYLAITLPTGLLTTTFVIDTVVALAVILPISYFTVMLRSKKTSPVERSRVVAFIPLFIASMFFWMVQEQGAVIGAIFAKERTDLHMFGMTIDPEWFQSIDPVAVVILAPVYALLWTKLGNRQISTPVKFGLGAIIGGLSWMMLALPGLISGTGVPVSAWWLIASFVIVVLGELMISPVGLSATTKLAPAAFGSQMMALWFLNNAAAQGINAAVTPLFEPSTEVRYFLIVGAVPIIAGCVIFAMSPWIREKMAGVH